MVNLIRRFQQPLMIAITILVIIAFAVLYNTNSLGRLGADRVATVNDRHVSLADYQRGLRTFELANDLQMRELLGSLGIPATSEEEFKRNVILGGLVLRQEAEKLGVTTTDDEVADGIKALPVFQTQGQFDSAKYNQIVQVALTPRGFTVTQLEEIVREDITLKKLKALLGATIAPAPTEVREAYVRDYQKTVASVVRLKLADFSASATVTDEEVKKAFEERKASFNAPEKRKVKYLALTLPEAEKPLAGKERVDALKVLSEKAADFSQAMLEPGADFDAVAAKMMLPVKESAEFSATDEPAELGKGNAVVDASFKLTKEQPTSDVLGTENGYFIVHLGGLIPTRPLTLDEAKPKLAESLKQEKSMEALNLKGTEIRNKIDAALKAGKSFADATAAAGVKAEAFPPFSRREPKFDQPDGQEVMISSIEMTPGQLSEFVPTATGGVLVHMDSREPIDDAKFSTEKALTALNLSRGRRESLFAEWFKARRREAGIVPLPKLAAPTPPPTA